jgi:phage gpG-like protein
MARVILDRSDLRRAANQANRDELREGARQVANRAKILTPVDTGRLRSSIKHNVTGDRATIETNVSYAPYVHDGTRPHVIRPRRRQALRFNVGGQTVFARIVNHPGTRARPFLVRALREIARTRGWQFRAGGIR